MAPLSSQQFTVLLFGDQTDPWVAGLDQLYKQASSTPWLKLFLENLSEVVRTELKALTLDAELRDSFGHFSSLQELGERYRHATDEFGVVRTLLLHVVKAGTLLQFVKRTPHLLNPDAHTEWLGISGGLLTLSALAIAHDFDSLYDALLEVTPLILRFCKVTSVRSRAAENETGAWGWAVLGISPDDLAKALAKFQRDAGIPTSKQAKVGIVGSGWSTAIGPPSVLRLFMEQCSAVKTLPNNPLEIRAMQHVLTVSRGEIDYMIGTKSSVLDRPLSSRNIRVWGLDKPDGNYSRWSDLLRDVFLQVLTRPLNIPEVFEALNASLPSASPAKILQVGTCGHSPLLSSTLKASGRRVSVEDQNSVFTDENQDQSSMSGRIAIVGMAGRGPGSDNIDEFWDVIMSKQNLCQEVPPDRFDVKEFYCSAHERGDERCKMTTKYGCFMDGPGHFDSRFFHISPREAILMDPGHRQFLMASYEALEMAGYSDGRTTSIDPHRIATFYSQATDDWLHQTHGTLGCDAYTMQGVQRAFGPGRLAWQFKWEGPTYSLDSACAGTTAGIHLACMSLLSKDIDMAVSGAANILSWPHSFTCLCDSGVLSNTGNCKTFRDDADGYCRADFVGAVVLKRLEDAIAHNDNILAVVAGSGRNHSGNSTSITTSDAFAQERLFEKVMRNAQVSPDDVSYVEMHGTGTPIGDPAEMSAVSSFFKHRKRNKGPLRVGGVKANVGHSEAAAGIAELFKCIMMFQTNTIPPQAGLPHALNPRFPPLKELGLEIPLEPMTYEKEQNKPRRILLNNFDAAGGNACMVVEEYGLAETPDVVADPRSSHVVTVSARTPAAYQANKRTLAEWLKKNPATKIQDVAYTSTARRMHHPFKFACPVSSVSDLINKLEASESSPPESKSQKPPIVFAFTGQGSHYAGMGAELYRTSPVFREKVGLCVAICHENGFPSFLELITDDQIDMSTKSAAQTQLAVVTLEIALTAFWQSIGIEPAMVIGHSLGEYAALHAAGVLSLADTLYLVGQRASMLLERCEAGSCAMLSLTASVGAVRDYLAKHPSSSCGIACINSPNATVVSGTTEDLASMQETMTAQDAKVRAKMLSLPYAFHSFQVDTILEDYANLATGVTYSAPKIPVASTLLASIVQEPGTFDQDYLVRQTRQPVDFVGGLDAIKSELKDPFWLEVGPAPICSSFVRATLSPPTGRILHSLESTSSGWTAVSKSMAALYLGGVAVDWLAFHMPFENSLKLLKLPAYAWTKKDYWVTFKKDQASVVGQAPAVVSEPFNTTSAQYLVSKSSSPKIQVTFRASLADPGFMALIDGHQMQQIGLASGSVFCDAAASVAKYALEFAGRKDVSAASLAPYDPELLAPLTKTLVGTDGELFTTAVMDSPTADVISCSFEAKSASGASHALGSITIKIHDPQKTQSAWDQVSYFIQAKMEQLIKNTKEGLGHRMQPEVLYQLFSNAVEFDPHFQGIQEAYVARDFQEAAAKVILKEDPSGSSFTASPYWAEALVHLAGFMVQGNPAKSPRTTFIVMGFDSAEQTAEFKAGQEYITYTRINRWEENTAFCDAYVFDPVSSKLLMQCRNLRYTELPRATWKHILEGGQVGGSKAHAPPPTTPKKSTIQATAKDEVASTAAQMDTTGPEPAQSSSSRQMFDLIVESIAKSTGTDSSEFTDATQVADLGVDSIMAIEIVSVAKSEYDLDLPAKFVFEYPTIGDLRREFGGASAPHEPPQVEHPSNSSSADSSASDSSHAYEVAESDSSIDSEPVLVSKAPSRPDYEMVAKEEALPPKVHVDDDSPQPSVRVTLLQGRQGPGRIPLYMMADGTGSVATYLHLPPFAGKTPVYGIDSPYVNCPSRLTSDIGIEGVAKLVVEGLTKHSPSGPLMIGGFSAGCHVAYEVCRQLGAAGRKVHGLVLIDLRAPTATKLSTAEILAEAERGVAALAVTVATDDLWSGTASAQQAHLRAYFVAMRSYNPPAMAAGERPAHAAVIWAEKGIVKRADGDARVLKALAATGFSLEPYRGFMEDGALSPMGALIPHKTEADLGPNGWDRFVGDVLTLSVDGDHLDICMPTHVHLLHERMEEAFRHFAAST